MTIRSAKGKHVHDLWAVRTGDSLGTLNERRIAGITGWRQVGDI